MPGQHQGWEMELNAWCPGDEEVGVEWYAILVAGQRLLLKTFVVFR